MVRKGYIRYYFRHRGDNLMLQHWGVRLVDKLNKTNEWNEPEDRYPETMSFRNIVREIHKRLHMLDMWQDSLNERNAELVMSGVCAGYTPDNIERIPNYHRIEEEKLLKMLNALVPPKKPEQQKEIRLEDLPF